MPRHRRPALCTAILAAGIALLASSAAWPYVLGDPEYVTVHGGGPTDRRIDVVAIGDGYVDSLGGVSPFATWPAIVDDSLVTLFQGAVADREDPSDEVFPFFRRYRKLFNVHRVNLRSVAHNDQDCRQEERDPPCLKREGGQCVEEVGPDNEDDEDDGDNGDDEVPPRLRSALCSYANPFVADFGKARAILASITYEDEPGRSLLDIADVVLIYDYNHSGADNAEGQGLGLSFSEELLRWMVTTCPDGFDDPAYCPRSVWDLLRDPDVDFIGSEWCYRGFPLGEEVWNDFIPLATVPGGQARPAMVARMLASAFGSLVDEYYDPEGRKQPKLPVPSPPDPDDPEQPLVLPIFIDGDALRTADGPGPVVNIDWAPPLDEPKWQQWIGVRGVDAYEGAAYEADNLRPTDQSCIMNQDSRELALCAVCGEEMIHRLYTHAEVETGLLHGLLHYADLFPSPVDLDPEDRDDRLQVVVSAYGEPHLTATRAVDVWGYEDTGNPRYQWCADLDADGLDECRDTGPEVDGDADPDSRWHVTQSKAPRPEEGAPVCLDPDTGEPYPFCPGVTYRVELDVDDSGDWSGVPGSDGPTPAIKPREDDPWHESRFGYDVRVHAAHGDLLRNLGASFLFGGFVDGEEGEGGGRGLYPGAIAVGDFNGDACPDVAFGAPRADVPANLAIQLGFDEEEGSLEERVLRRLEARGFDYFRWSERFEPPLAQLTDEDREALRRDLLGNLPEYLYRALGNLPRGQRRSEFDIEVDALIRVYRWWEQCGPNLFQPCRCPGGVEGEWGRTCPDADGIRGFVGNWGPVLTRLDAGVVWIQLGVVGLDGEGCRFISDSWLNPFLSHDPPDLLVFGAEANGLLGSSLAAGDFDGDGVDDLVIGAPGVEDGDGRAYLVLDLPGRLNPLVSNAGWLPSSLLDLYDAFLDLAHLGEEAGGVLVIEGEGGTGTAVAAAPLMGPREPEADGPSDDVVVGAPRATCVDDEPEHGCVLVLDVREGFGEGGAVSIGGDLVPDAGAPARMVRISGPHPGSEFGSSFAAGDFEGSGELNLAIGAPGDEEAAPPNGQRRRSGAYLLADLRGISSFAPCLRKPEAFERCRVDRSVAGDETAVLWRVLVAPGDGESAGASLAAGDVDRDGLDDLVVGAPTWGRPFREGRPGDPTYDCEAEPDVDCPVSEVGRVHILFGSRSRRQTAPLSLINPLGPIPHDEVRSTTRSRSRLGGSAT